MGIRFTFKEANLLSWLLSERKRARFLDVNEHLKQDEQDVPEDNSLQTALRRIQLGYRSSPLMMERLANSVDIAIERLDSGRSAYDALEPARNFLANRPWTALIVPPWTADGIQDVLCSESYLQELINGWPGGGGIVLQLTEPPQDRFSLVAPFPAFRMALARRNQWPGLLIWNSWDSMFITAKGNGEQAPENIRGVLYDLIRYSENLHRNGVHTDKVFQMAKEWFEPQESLESDLHILQFSDLHFGSPDATQWLNCLDRAVNTLLVDYGGGSNIIPVISGDLIDDPNVGFIEEARSFMETLSERTGTKVFCVKGNHDCRRGGWLWKGEVNISDYVAYDPVRWVDSHSLGIIGFDSCDGSKLARGVVTDKQLSMLKIRVKEKPEHNLIGVVHHHPKRVHIPDWIADRTIERLTHAGIGWTQDFGNAEKFLSFVKKHNFIGILHGHKHIPREHYHDGLPIIGAGSASGLIESRRRGRLLSINVITIKRHTSELQCHFHIEDSLGERVEYKEIVWRTGGTY